MKKILFLAAVIIFSCSCALFQGVTDDFSAKDWKLKENTTNGKISYENGKLKLFNSSDFPAYCAVHKEFTVDLDLTPVFSIRLSGEEATGVIRMQIGNGKRIDILRYRENGLYSANVADKLGVSGPQKLRVYLYVESHNRTVEFSDLSFTMDKPVNTVEKQSIRKSRVVPTFHSASYYVSMPKVDEELKVAFRKLPAGKWQDAYPPIRDEEDGNYRGSIVNLEENSDYLLRVFTKDQVYFKKSFRTWRSNVPIGKTITLTKENYAKELADIKSGKPYAWVKYISDPGVVITNDGTKPLLSLDRKQYIVFEGLTFKGGNWHAADVTNCNSIRFINCEFSGWGRKGVQRLDLDGTYFPEGKNSPTINLDGAIELNECRNVVVERCFFHDPRGRANSWQYSHPAGPEAIVLGACEGTVIRYNDMIGSDEHRWNDAVESRGNFILTGGISRDADVYGNFMIYSSDDCIELDGGQQNIRCFGNRFEGALCGVSIQGCMKGPSYVFDNITSNMGDEYEMYGQGLKTNSKISGKYAKSFIFNNTFTGNGGGLTPLKVLPLDIYNNVFVGTHSLYTDKVAWNNDNNLVPRKTAGHGANTIVAKDPGFAAPEVDNFAPAKGSLLLKNARKLNNFSDGKILGAVRSSSSADVLPKRPLPVVSSANTLRFASGVYVKTFTLKADKDTEFEGSFKIVKPEVFTWFEVTPAAGKIKNGEEITFTVKLQKERMPERENWRGAVAIRFEDGLSRPVAVYAKGKKSDLAAEVKKHNAFFLELDMEKPTRGKQYPIVKDAEATNGTAVKFMIPGYDPLPAPAPADKDISEYDFTVPKDGWYFVIFKSKAKLPTALHDSVYSAVDSKKLTVNNLGGRTKTYWNWSVPTGLSHRTKPAATIGAFYLKKGKHTLFVAPREAVLLDTIAITDNNKIFMTW